MATDANSPIEPEQEPDVASTPAPGNGDDRTIELPAPFVENLPPEILESLPPDIRENLRRSNREVVTHTSTSFTSMSMMMLGRVVNPIADKITPQHITDIIGITSREADYADRQLEREYSSQKHTRNWYGVLIGMVILAVTIISIVLVYQGLLDFLRDMAMLIIPAVGGVGIGTVIGFRIGIRYANARTRQ